VLRFEAKTTARLEEIMAIFKDKLDQFAAVSYDPEDFSV